MPRALTVRKRQLLDRRIRLFGIGNKPWHACACEDLTDVAILAEHYARDAFSEYVLIINSPFPAVA